MASEFAHPYYDTTAQQHSNQEAAAGRGPPNSLSAGLDSQLHTETWSTSAFSDHPAESSVLSLSDKQPQPDMNNNKKRTYEEAMQLLASSYAGVRHAAAAAAGHDTSSGGSGLAKFHSYHMSRLQTSANHVLFYLVDSQNHAHLAIVGTDVRLSGHFVYCSLPAFRDGPPVRCTNRVKVMEWLASLGGSEAADPDTVKVPNISKEQLDMLLTSDPMFSKPKLDADYTSWREEGGRLPDGRHFKQYYLIEAVSRKEKLVITAEDSHRKDRRYAYKAVPEMGGFAFENGQAVREWLDFVVGRTPPGPLARPITRPRNLNPGGGSGRKRGAGGQSKTGAWASAPSVNKVQVDASPSSATAPTTTTATTTTSSMDRHYSAPSPLATPHNSLTTASLSEPLATSHHTHLSSLSFSAAKPTASNASLSAGTPANRSQARLGPILDTATSLGPNLGGFLDLLDDLDPFPVPPAQPMTSHSRDHSTQHHQHHPQLSPQQSHPHPHHHPQVRQAFISGAPTGHVLRSSVVSSGAVAAGKPVSPLQPQPHLPTPTRTPTHRTRPLCLHPPPPKQRHQPRPQVLATSPSHHHWPLTLLRTHWALQAPPVPHQAASTAWTQGGCHNCCCPRTGPLS